MDVELRDERLWNWNDRRWKGREGGRGRSKGEKKGGEEGGEKKGGRRRGEEEGGRRRGGEERGRRKEVQPSFEGSTETRGEGVRYIEVQQCGYSRRQHGVLRCSQCHKRREVGLTVTTLHRVEHYIPP